MEFNGSKGNWKAVFVEENIRAIRNEGGVIMRFWKPFKYSGQDERFYSELKETQANQKICLHAPELLEMVKKLHNLLEEHQPNWYLLGHHREIESLIKEATTI